MSVVSSKRNETKFDFYDQAVHLRYNMTKFLMCNFGTSKSYKDTTFYANHNKLTEEDKKILEDIAHRYGKDFRIEVSYPYWILEYERETLLSLLRDLMEHIVIANTIYPNSADLYNLKQKHINLAITDCQSILTEFEFIAIMFNSPNMDLSCFDPYLDEINDLINKLKKFRSRTNGQKTFAYQQDLETKNKAIYYIDNNILVTNQNGTIKTCDQYKKEVSKFNKDVIITSKPIDNKIIHPTFNSNIFLPDSITNNSYVQQMVYEESHWHMSDVDTINKTYTSRNYTYDKYTEDGQPVYPAAIFDAVKFE